MAKVLIVSKTHMSNAACVGGLTKDGEFVRLLDENGCNQPEGTEYQIRQFWNVDFRKKRPTYRPHVEDVIVSKSRYDSDLHEQSTMLSFIEGTGIQVTRGIPDNLFGGCLNWTEGGSGYVSRDGEIPNNSVGFWIPDRSLRLRPFRDNNRYNYPSNLGWRSIKYVGYNNPIDEIPEGTLVRVSLARWWDRNGETEPRCYLQLSGWYELGDDGPDFGPQDAGFPDYIPY